MTAAGANAGRALGHSLTPVTTLSHVVLIFLSNQQVKLHLIASVSVGEKALISPSAPARGTNHTRLVPPSLGIHVDAELDKLKPQPIVEKQQTQMT